MPRIITIARQFSSGGRELGKRLAEQLGIAYYDKEIYSAISEKSGLADEYVHSIVEKKITTFYPIVIGQTFSYPYDIEPQTSVMATQTEIIEEMAQKGDCVIVGRCADYILKDYNPLKVFVFADMESRIARARTKNDADNSLTDAEFKKKIQKIDKARGKYYEFYTGQKWGEMQNYDLCINASNMNVKDLVPAVEAYFKALK